MEHWRFVFVIAAAVIAIATAQLHMFCGLGKEKLEMFMECGKDGFSSEASSGWSSCKEEVLSLTDVNATDTQAILYMCEQNKTRMMESCMKKSGKQKVHRKARAKMMTCMMSALMKGP